VQIISRVGSVYAGQARQIAVPFCRLAVTPKGHRSSGLLCAALAALRHSRRNIFRLPWQAEQSPQGKAFGKAPTAYRELKAAGELANTLIVYTGDHGLNTCHHGMWEKGNGTVPQNFLEESIRVSCALSWPAGGIRQNATCDDSVNHCDLWATLLDVAGASPAAAVAEQVNSPGVSYLPQLRGAADPLWR
jgi:hypothetical protein